MPSSYPLAAAVAVIALAAPSIPEEQVHSQDGKGASDGDEIGYSIALEGKYLISGTPNEDFGGTDTGYVNCYKQIGSQWGWVYEDIFAEGLEDGDQFGWSVDLSGKYAIVGAPGDDDQGTQAGAAYIFARGSDGEWTVEDKIIDDDGNPDDNFGHAVAIDGKYGIVSAPLFDFAGEDSGRVVFIERQRDGTWSIVGSANGASDPQASPLAALGTLEQARIGWSVAIEGKTAAVGAPGPPSGRVFVFRRTPQGWTFEDLVTEGDSDNEFGASIALSGKYLIVGAPTALIGMAGTGLAYVYARQSNGSWELEDTLQAPSPAGGDQFGAAVSISGTIAVIGAPRDNNDNGVNAGCYYVFKRARTGSWDLVAGPVVANDGLADAEFGRAIAIDKKNVAVGAPYHSDSTGRTYVFR